MCSAGSRHSSEVGGAEVEGLVERLAEYRDALRENDRERMRALLREGREMKERLEE